MRPGPTARLCDLRPSQAVRAPQLRAPGLGVSVLRTKPQLLMVFQRPDCFPHRRGPCYPTPPSVGTQQGLGGTEWGRKPLLPHCP